MTRTATRLLITLTLAAGATAANAQMSNSGAAAPVPGSGDAAKISQGNQQNNAAYNQLIGAGDAKSGKADVKAKAHQAPVAAGAADIKPGASLRDIKGVPIGSIASSDGQQVVVDTGTTKIGVPLIAFGKDEQGLLLSITADKFNQLVAAAHAKSQASN
jgi:hypothetical protein